MRESLAASINSKNLQQQDTSCSLDRLHAVALSAIHNPIGSASLRFVDSLQPSAYNELTNQLAREAVRKLKCDKKILLRVCKQVIHENVFSFCKKCKGTKEQQGETKIIICNVCNGTGLHRHGDADRAHAIGLSIDNYLKYWEKRLMLVQSIYTYSRRLTVSISQEKLYA